MKKRASFMAAAFAAGFMAVALVDDVFAAQIQEEKAKSIALENSGTKEEDVIFLSAEQDVEDGKVIFEVELLTKSKEEFDYEISAETGEILSISYENKNRPVREESSSAAITLEQAKEIALTHADVDADKVTWIKQKKDVDDGRFIYELEFYTDTYQEYEYDIDERSREITAWEFDADSAYARQDAAKKLREAAKAADSVKGKESDAAKKGITNLEEAKTAALKRAGLKNEDVTWGRVRKTFDDGKSIYEGKFFCNSLEYEFEIDAATGAVVDWDVESIYD